jgi:hypothetical protein
MGPSPQHFQKLKERTSMRKTAALLLFISLGLLPCLAEDHSHECSLAGSWYGGSPSAAKYLLQITHEQNGLYNATYYGGFTPAITRLSPWTGSIMKGKHGEYIGRGIALANYDATAANLPSAVPPDIWAVRELIVFDGCDKLVSTIVFYKGYHWGKTPFVDLPDYDRMPPGATTVQEIYTRMPMCAEAVCPN